jgi:uncharacterized protein YjeT (DUF2065 family)
LTPLAWTSPEQARWLAVAIGLFLVLAALAIYMITAVDRYYDHFVWQASAFLEGQAAIRYTAPSSSTSIGNGYFQDVLPVPTADGIPRGLLPFPPLPGLVLVPFVAVWGLATDDQTIFTILAAIDIALCWWALGRLPVSTAVRFATTVFFAFGTVFWYTAQLATSWYQAHIVAVGLVFVALGLALGGDPRGAHAEATDADDPPDRRRHHVRVRRPTLAVEPRQFAAGLLFGLACTARLTIVFGAPFFVLVGAGGTTWRRGWSAGVGAAIPLVGLLVYTVVSTGHLFNPAYDYLYRLETSGYPALGYHADWGLEDLRYVPQNLGVGLFGAPVLLPTTVGDSLGVFTTSVCTLPGAVRGLFDVRCPLAVPRDTGMSVILTSPAYLLAVPLLARFGRDRLTTGATIAVVLIAFVNLMHFSQGWVQFGYRFSNDAAPFALLLVAVGMQRLVDRRSWGMRLAVGLVLVSLAVNAWGVLWSRLLGW